MILSLQQSSKDQILHDEVLSPIGYFLHKIDNVTLNTFGPLILFLKMNFRDALSGFCSHSNFRVLDIIFSAVSGKEE